MLGQGEGWRWHTRSPSSTKAKRRKHLRELPNRHSARPAPASAHDTRSPRAARAPRLTRQQTAAPRDASAADQGISPAVAVRQEPASTPSQLPSQCRVWGARGARSHLLCARSAPLMRRRSQQAWTAEHHRVRSRSCSGPLVEPTRCNGTEDLERTRWETSAGSYSVALGAHVHWTLQAFA